MAAPSKVVHGPASLDFISPYIYFSYSSTYQAVRQPPAGTSLQMAMLSADTSYQKHLAVAVFPLDAGGLDGFSPYAVRKVQPALYKRADVPVKGGTAIVFSKADNSEITAIIPHADKLATLSFTTASSYDDLSTEVNALLKSFYWKP